MPDAPQKIWSVSEVNSVMRDLVENTFYPFWLKAEVGTINIYRSGHVYLTLKDSKSKLKAVFFGGAAQAQKMGLRPGLEIEASGKLAVYEPNGEYQFSIKGLRPVGMGDLFRLFEEMKKKLAAEGLFDQGRKRPVPVFPRRIGVVTSPDGAAVRDFLQIINRRFPNIHIKIYPSAVQGKGAELELARGVAFFNQRCPVDVIILMRGGGSMEDLWPFNEEALARAVSASAIPTISAVGHEIDFTICDFAADLRVPTPSAAAELVIGRQSDFEEKVAALRQSLERSLRFAAERLLRRYERAAGSAVFREPLRLVREKQQRVDDLAKSLETYARHRLEKMGLSLEKLDGRLAALSPLSVIKRGYAIITDPETGAVVMSPDQLRPGAALDGRVAGGVMRMTFERAERKDIL